VTDFTAGILVGGTIGLVIGTLACWPLGLSAFALAARAWMRSRPPY
jgi:hypothetical protein